MNVEYIKSLDQRAQEVNASSDRIYQDAFERAEMLKTQTLTELDALIEAAPNAGEKKELFSLEDNAERLIASTLKKISEQLGSNPGGWHEDAETKKHYYIKFYKNPDQARTEFVANEIYRRLRIKAAQSELFEMDKRLAIASAAIPDAQPAYWQEQLEDQDVRAGFVADAYLANWDVFGLNWDNIVRGKDGMYRIDNGGTLTFRAQGDAKIFSSDTIPELDTMRDPHYASGRIFNTLSEDDVRNQAVELAERLQENDIENIVRRSGMNQERADATARALIGRRRFLMEKFQILETAQNER